MPKQRSALRVPRLAEVDWGNTPLFSEYIAVASATIPRLTAKACGETLVFGLSLDPLLVAAAVAAHSNFVASRVDFAAIDEALARMIVSADEQQFSVFSVLSLTTRSS